MPSACNNPTYWYPYAMQKGLEKHPGWKWVKEYQDFENAPQNVRRAFQAAAAKAPKFKFSVEVPHLIQQALWLDAKNGNHQWEEAINTELAQINTYKMFKIAAQGDITAEHTRIPYHFVFDVKFDMQCKARLVASGNHTQPSKEDIVSGIVGMETVRIGFLIAAMNRLKVCAADIGNAFLYGTTKEKVFIVAGQEFGDNKGKRLLIDKGLYGLCSSSVHFHKYLSTRLRQMGYSPSRADPDFWIKNLGNCYEYVAEYIDDVLIFGANPMALIEELKRDYIREKHMVSYINFFLSYVLKIFQVLLEFF